ncbi:MAG: nucleotidyltransferase family protein [Bacillota bacterium]|nr:nucleotidyltransferase family protein [Bacillota bacterium]
MNIDIVRRESLVYFLKLLRAGLYNKTPEPPNENVNFKLVYDLLNSHMVLNIAYPAVMKLPIEQQPPEDLLLKMKDYFFAAKAKEAVQFYETEQVKACYEASKVPYCLLKGSVMKYYYQSPDLRTMCDIDILIQSNDVQKTYILMKQLGFTVTKTSYADNGYFKPPLVEFEIHRVLCDKAFTELFAYYENFWDKLIKKSNSGFEYIMKPEDFYIYMIAHIYKHFLVGGIGIRAIMDIYIFLDNFDKTLNWQYINEELSKIKLNKHEAIMKEIAFNWFAKDRQIQEFSELELFIFDSNAYGKTAFSVNSHLLENSEKDEGKAKKVGPVQYMLHVIFPSKTHFSHLYESYEKHPYFLPFYWIHMWFVRIFIKRNVNVFKTVSYLKHVDSKRIDYLRKIKVLAGIEEK